MQVETMQRGDRLPSQSAFSFFLSHAKMDNDCGRNYTAKGHIREIQNQLAKSCYQPGDVDQNNEVCKTPKVCRQVDDGDVSSPG